MSRFARILALLLVAAAIVLAVLAFSLSRPQATPPATQAPVASTAPAPGHPAVVAATSLKAGAAIQPAMLRLDTLPAAPEGAFDGIDAVVGRIPRQAIAEGTVVTANHLAQGMALQLLPGERALAIPVDEVSGVGNRVVPGDFVDVFFELKEDQERHGDTQARLLLSRIHVLAYGNSVLAASPSADAASNAPVSQSGTRADSPSPRTAVLAVPVDMVDRLLLAVREGKLSLALRHPDDHLVADTALFSKPQSVLSARQGLTSDQQASLAHPENAAFAGIDVEGLAGRGGNASAQPTRPAHAKRMAPAGGGVEIIRGTQRSKLFATSPCTAGKECSP